MNMKTICQATLQQQQQWQRQRQLKTQATKFIFYSIKYGMAKIDHERSAIFNAFKMKLKINEIVSQILNEKVHQNIHELCARCSMPHVRWWPTQIKNVLHVIWDEKTNRMIIIIIIQLLICCQIDITCEHSTSKYVWPIQFMVYMCVRVWGSHCDHMFASPMSNGNV